MCEKDRELVKRVGIKNSHSSTLEHINVTMQITDVSRALLQEIVRHRISSYTVKSTRFTLKKDLKNEEPFISIDNDKNRANKYIIMTGNTAIDESNIMALERTRQFVKSNISNDIAKYCLPESYKTELTWTINARSLQNFLSLRSTKAALWEIRDLANALYDCLPNEHKYLFEDFIN